MKQTPIQHATALVLGAYMAAVKTLTAAEADALRGIIAARLGMDYVEALGVLDEQEREAA